MTALVAVIAAAVFTGCGAGSADGRLSVKQYATGYFQSGLLAVQEEENGKWGYIDNKGAMKIAKQYDGASAFVSGAAIIRQETANGNGEYFLIDNKDKAVSEKYDYIDAVGYDRSDYNKVLFIGEKGGGSDEKVVFMDAKGKETVSFKAAEYEDVILNAAVVSNGKTGAEIKYGAVNILNGKEILPKEYDGIEELKSWGYYDYFPLQTFLKIQKGTGANEKYGFATLEGKVITAAKYIDLGNFYNGAAAAKVDGTDTDFIDTNGKTLFTVNTTGYTYSSFGRFDNKGVMIYHYAKDGKTHYTAVNKKGAVMAETDSATLGHNAGSDFILKTSSDGGKTVYTVLGLNGKEIKSVTNTDAVTYNYVEAYTRFGFTASQQMTSLYTTKMYNTSGKETSTLDKCESSNSVKFYSSGYGTVSRNDANLKYSDIIDINGKILIGNAKAGADYYIMMFKDVDCIMFTSTEGLYTTGYQAKAGLMNSKGKILLKAKQSEVLPNFGGGSLFAAKSWDGKWGFVDKTGEFKIAAEYAYASYFIGGLAAVQSGKKTGFVNTKGKKVIECKYVEIGGNI